LIEYIEQRILSTMETSPTALFAALANESRLRCLVLLSSHVELCVCELTYALELSQPHVSRHLAQLRESGLVTDRREGIWVYYRIATDLPPWVLQVLERTARGLAGRGPFDRDAASLAAMPNRPGAARCA
jgi:ArsR family transcriptional regulator, arsenate/arsenite/antimonite-responsive transcriptional repressor